MTMRWQGLLRGNSRSVLGKRDLHERIIGSAEPIKSGHGMRQESENGQAIVETAIALPVIAAFAFMMIEVCLAFYTYCMISESAREGTRYAIVRGSTCQTSTGASCTASASTMNSVVTHLGWPNLGNGTMSVNTTYPDVNENPGSRVQVVVTYVFPYNIPFAPKGTIRMSSTSVMYIVQ
ncbi:MAG: TadE/TadG family type IV pilus assembly protein [Limisphaerales bacterium]